MKHRRGDMSGLSEVEIEEIKSDAMALFSVGPEMGFWDKYIRRLDSETHILQKRSKRVRKRVRQIEEDLDSLDDNDVDLKDTIILQHFIIDHLSPYERKSIRQQMMSFDNTEPDLVNGLGYVISWILISILWLFCMYWMLVWGVAQSGEVFQSFFITFFLGFAEEVILIGPLKIVLLHLAPSLLMSDQLTNTSRKCCPMLHLVINPN